MRMNGNIRDEPSYLLTHKWDAWICMYGRLGGLARPGRYFAVEDYHFEKSGLVISGSSVPV